MRRLRARSFRFWCVALGLTAPAVCAATAPAQVPPPREARAALESRPELAEQVRQRMQASGMSAEQIRTRLKALGYPETLLDSYMPGGEARRAVAAPNDQVLTAVAALGVADSSDVASLSALRDRRAAGSESPGAPTADARVTDGRPVPGRAADDQRDAARSADSLPVFGMSMFSQATSAFDPNAAGPVDASYRLGAGDRLVVLLSGAVEAAHTLDVTREGFVVIPQVGQLPVANMTLGQFEELLERRLRAAFGAVQRGTGPASPSLTRFTVSVARLRSNQVVVVGDVVSPGSYRISSAGTALSALYVAGGPTASGSFRRVLVRRGGVVVGTLDLYDYLLEGNAAGDVRLENGDVVFVPVAGAQVQLRGEVRRPAVYELRDGEMLADVVRMAGGFTAEASQQRIQIDRVLPPAERTGPGHERVLLDVSAERLAGGTVPSLALASGDVVRVFPVSRRVTNRVTVQGHVWAEGAQALRAGMRLSDALRHAGLRPDTYLGQVLVSRLRSDSSRQQLRAMLADTTGTVIGDLALADADEIRVFSVGEFRPERYVAITGAVARPGRYPYRAGMTLRDLALQAGGLRESASLVEAEVARMMGETVGGRESVTMRVPLDSSYVFEQPRRLRRSASLAADGADMAAGEHELQPYDNVLILQRPSYVLPRTVTVTGAVRFPGEYTLETNGDRIADVLRRAGGVNPEAHVAGATFTRALGGIGTLGIDLPSALRDPRHRDNHLLEDGDVIVVPRYQAVVMVRGAVFSPMAVAYVPGASLDYYLRSAGGTTRQADQSRAYATQPNGRVESVVVRRLLPNSSPVPQAGSTITVPVRDESQKHDRTQTLTAFGQALAALVGVIAIVKR